MNEIKKKEMSLFKKKYLKEIRANLVKEVGGDIPDEDWNKIVREIEGDIKKGLEKELPKAFWFPLYEMAEKGDIIVKLDGVDIGATLRQLRPIYEWLIQKRKYFGW